LIGTKIDTKVVGILIGHVHILEKVELMADKSTPQDVSRMFQINARTSHIKSQLNSAGNSSQPGHAPQRKSSETGIMKKLSQNPLETYNLIQGLAKNL
jgi:hypothetical protein